MKRILGAAGVMAVFAVQAFAIAPHAGATTSFWCSDRPAPCIQSASLNGTPLASTDATWSFYIGVVSAGHRFQWGVSKIGHPEGFGLASLSDVWVVQIDTGTAIPRVVFTHGNDVAVNRHDDGDGTYHITVTASPIQIVGDCDQTAWPWTCPEIAGHEWDGYLDGEVLDYNEWSDPVQRDSMYGMDFSSNIAATSLPPEIIGDPATGAQQILIRLADPHYLMDGSTPFVGFAHQRIPNAFLQEVYGIDAPATLTSGGLAPAVSGPATGSGTLSVTEAPGGGAMLVDATGLTFSSRKLVVHRGVITPTRAQHPQAIRLGPSNGRIRFGAASPRGSRITGYRARCIAPNGSALQVASSGSPMAVPGLRGGTPYDCTLRANSKAGLGPATAKFRMPAHA